MGSTPITRLGSAKSRLPADGFLAVDVGGSWVKSGLVADGQVEKQSREPVARDLDGLVAQLNRVAEGRDWGLCVPGLVENGSVRYAANLPLRDTPLPELLDPPAPRLRQRPGGGNRR